VEIMTALDLERDIRPCDSTDGAPVRQSSLTRRRLLTLFGVTVGSVAATSLLAACGGDDDDDDDGDGAASATQAPSGTTAPSSATTAATAPSGATAAATTATGGEAPTQGGHLRVGQSGEPDTLDMHRTPSSVSWEVGWALYDLLIIADEDLTLYPWLATSWEVSEDFLTFTFHLRDDVVFHDGTKFNAEAVKYNLDRVVDPATGSLYSIDDLGPYSATNIIDEYTAEVVLSETFGTFLRAMSLMEFGMLSPSVASMAVEDVGRNPIGSGPFKFVSWTTQDRIELERFAEYNWGPSPPYSHSGPAHLDQVTFQFIPDAPTRVAALEAGEVDAIMRTPGTESSRLQAETDTYKVVFGLQTGMPSGFYVNIDKFPTDDNAVRRAINLGLDREQISGSLYAGQEAAGYCPLTPTTFTHWDCTGEIYYAPDEAEQLLQDAGWTKSGDFYEKDGQTLTIDLYIFGTSGAAGEAFQAAIRPVGIDVNLQVVPFTEQMKVGFEGLHNLMIGRFDAPDPNIMRLLFHSENIGATGFTWTHVKDANPDLQAQIDELLVQGDAEADPAKRAEIYTEIQQLIVENNLFVALKYDANQVTMKVEVQGWRMNDLGFQPRVYDVYLEEQE
jgi:peptide/nickel transport system substrate-binding protein